MKIKNLTMSKDNTNICVSVLAPNEKDILKMMEKAKASHADLIEWRCDAFDDVSDLNIVIELLKKIKVILDGKPLIFTYRSKNEGGRGSLDGSEYLLLVKTAILTKLIDFVDIELLLGDSMISNIVKHARLCDVKVIISNHDFDSTPRYDVMENRIKIMHEKGADIAKVSYMPKTQEDVEVVKSVAKQLCNYNKLLVLISMGELGRETRINAKELGSCITFASLGEDRSAPGQIDVETLYKLIQENKH